MLKDIKVVSRALIFLGRVSLIIGATGFSVTKTGMDRVRMVWPDVTRIVMEPFPEELETIRNETRPSSGTESSLRRPELDAESRENWVLVMTSPPLMGPPSAESVIATSTATVSLG